MTLAANLKIKSSAIAHHVMALLFRSRSSFFALICAIFLFIGCSPDNSDTKGAELHTFSGSIMGTLYTVKYLPPNVSTELASVEQVNTQIHARLVRVDELMSTYKQDSEVSRFNAAPPGEWFEISVETFEVIKLAQHISHQTQGAFDITVANLVDLWGFGPNFQKPEVPDFEQLKAIHADVGYQHLQLHDSATKLRKQTTLQIDLSAIAKGYGVDQVADYLDEIGISSYMVEVGGEIRTRGKKPDEQPWRIAIEAPNTQQRDIHSIIDVTDLAVATSGDYRNYFEQDGQRFSHTIDPKTGYPITHNLASVTVIGRSAAKVDALATAFSVLGSDQAMRYAKAYNVAAYFIVKEKEGFIGKASDAFISMTQ